MVGVCGPAQEGPSFGERAAYTDAAKGDSFGDGQGASQLRSTCWGLLTDEGFVLMNQGLLTQPLSFSHTVL